MNKQRTKILILLLLISGFFAACSSRQSAKTNKAFENDMDSAQFDADSLMAALEEEEAKAYRSSRSVNSYGEDFKKLIVSFDGVFRGIQFDMTPAQVKAAENAKLTKETPDLLTYKVELSSEAELAWLSYKFNKEKKLAAIYTQIQLDDNESFEALLAEIIDFFTLKYGDPRPDAAGNETWNIRNTYRLTLQDSIRDKVFEITIDVK